MKQVTVEVLEPYKELYNPDWRYIAYYGGRASGKSHAVAQALLIRGRAEKLRILCTREVQNTIKDSVHKLLADLIDKYGFNDYEVLKDSIRNRATGTEFIFKGLKHNINEIKSTEGIDICWVEEAQSITKASLDILTPTIRKKGSQLFFTYNRFHELDPIHVAMVIDNPPKTFALKVNYDLLERNGLLPDVIKLEIEKDRENPALFAHKWLGEPISQDELSIIPRDKILNAMQREVEADGKEEIGVDVARMGNDRSVIVRRKGHKTLDYKIINKNTVPELCDMIEQFSGFNKETFIKVDDTGVGGGVTDELQRRGYNVLGINFGSEARDKDKYPNWISEAWFYMSENMKDFQLPYDSDLLMELSTRNWQQDTKGKRRVESKNEYKKRGFRSPDLADAFIICFAQPKALTVGDFAL